MLLCMEYLKEGMAHVADQASCGPRRALASLVARGTVRAWGGHGGTQAASGSMRQ